MIILTLHSESSSNNEGWVVKVGPVSGDIYMYGYMNVSSSNYIKFVRIDSSYNVKFTTAYSGYPNIEAWEVDSAESKIYTLLRPSSGFTMGIFDAANGINMQIYTSSQLSSVSINSALILDSSNTMAILNVKDVSGNLAICQFTFSNQQMNWIKVSGAATPEWIGIVSSTNDLFYTAIISSNLIFQRAK